MKKMTTLFKKDLTDLSKVIDGEYNEGNLWVFDEGVKATRKFDGTAVAIIDGELYKRYDAKKGKIPPEGAIPCQEPDLITGHWPHWVKVDFEDNNSKWIVEAFYKSVLTSKLVHMFLPNMFDGTYEACGPKIGGNKENLKYHILVKHGQEFYPTELVLSSPREFMKDLDIEGIVFHHPDGRMCKIRKCDFGDPRVTEGD